MKEGTRTENSEHIYDTYCAPVPKQPCLQVVSIFFMLRCHKTAFSIVFSWQQCHKSHAFLVWWKRYEEATANRSSTKGQMKLLEYIPPSAQPGLWHKIVTSKKSLMLFGPRNRIRESCRWLTSSAAVAPPDPTRNNQAGTAAADDAGKPNSVVRRRSKTRAASPMKGPQGRWRKIVGRRQVHRLARFVFEAVQVCAVGTLLVVVALDAELTSGRRTSADETSTMRLLEAAAVSVFLAEALVLIVAQGLILLPGAYLRDSSNVFNFSLSVLSAVCLWAFGGVAWAGSLPVSTLKALRALNVVRLLRLARLSRSLTDLLKALRSSGKSLCLVGGAVLFFWLQWAIIGLQVLLLPKTQTTTFATPHPLKNILSPITL